VELTVGEQETRRLRSSRSGGVVIVILLAGPPELIVEVECVRADDHRAQARVCGYLGRERRGTALLGATPFEQLPHAGRVNDLAGVGLGERGIECGGAVLIERTAELIGNVPEVLPSLRAAENEVVCMRRCVVQAVHAAVFVGFAFLGHELRDVVGILDALVSTPHARVRGDDGEAVDDPHAIGGGDDRERAAHMGMRHRVIVEVEAHVGRLADVDRYELVTGEAGLGQRQQPRLFIGEGFADGL